MKNLLITICSIFLFASCSSSEDKPAPDVDLAMADCLQNFGYAYDKLLTREDISRHLTIDEASFKKEVRPNKDQYGSCKYTWDSDRPELEMELLGQMIKYPDRNIVEVKNLNFYSNQDLELYNHKSFVDLFEMGYKPLSDAEYNQLKANAEKELATNAEALENALRLLEIRREMQYQAVANLGTRAYWKWDATHGIELTVLAGTATFTIVAKTADNAQEGLSAAVKFAQEVLDKCKR